ncbi:HNH endonuclease family protein [Buttiauxella agrestis]
MFNSICSLRPSGIEGLYAKCARNLSSATNRTDARRVINELTGTLSQKKPSKDNFVDKYKKLQFSNKNTTNKKLIQYIFIKYERHLRQTNEFEPSDFSLEHIMPQSDATIADEIKSCIGNLLPLGQSLNGQANILTFDEKKEVYRQSDYRVVDKFLERTPQNIWTAQDIDNRTTELAELSYDDIWL